MNYTLSVFWIGIQKYKNNLESVIVRKNFSSYNEHDCMHGNSQAALISHVISIIAQVRDDNI